MLKLPLLLASIEQLGQNMPAIKKTVMVGMQSLGEWIFMPGKSLLSIIMKWASCKSAGLLTRN
jgi:hypothetical protein